MESEVPDASKGAVFSYTFTLSDAMNTQRNKRKRRFYEGHSFNTKSFPKENLHRL